MSGINRPENSRQYMLSSERPPAYLGDQMAIAEQILSRNLNINPTKIRGMLSGILDQAGCCLPGGIDPGCAIRSGRMNGMRRNPNIPDVNVVLDNVIVPIGQPIVAFFLLNATQRGVAAPWAVAANREYLLGQNNPRGLDGFYQNMWLTSVNPILEVTMADLGGVINRNASQEATALFQKAIGFFVDPNGTGTNLSVDATLVEDYPEGGLALSSDQVFQYSLRSLCRFDQIGIGEYQNWAVLPDLQFTVQMTMTVRAGVKANFDVRNPYGPTHVPSGPRGQYRGVSRAIASPTSLARSNSGYPVQTNIL